MLKYRVFFTYSGVIYDAYKNDVINVDLCENSPEEVASILDGWDRMGELRKDLTYVILPCFIPTK